LRQRGGWPGTRGNAATRQRGNAATRQANHAAAKTNKGNPEWIALFVFAAF
jgi:hypothetical protein